MMAILVNTALAWAINDASSIGLKTRYPRPSRSSGASAFVNATLNPSAAMPKAREDAVARWREAHGMVLHERRWITSRYVTSTRSHKNLLCAGRTVLAMSGSPACFWPVWFQTRTTRRSTSREAADQDSSEYSNVKALRLYDISKSHVTIECNSYRFKSSHPSQLDEAQYQKCCSSST